MAIVLHLRDVFSPGLDSRRAVALSHACLLSLGAVALFLHTSRSHRVPVAFAVGVLYAIHPLNLLIARNLTYYTLHIAFVTFATLALFWALQSQGRRMPWALAAGVLWGVATLVRPVSLLLPPFVLLLARWDGGKGSWRSALRFTSLFTLGMALVIGPYTLRNYRLTHRLIVVNAQDGQAFWGLSATTKPGGDTGEWVALWKDQGDAIFRRASGGVPYSIEALHDHALPVNDAFRAETARNIRRDPRKFASNVLRNVLAFNMDYSHRWLERLDPVRDGWDWPPWVVLAQLLNLTILLLSLFGIVRGLRDGDTHARVVVTIYVMFWVAHCVMVLMTRYTYVRFPLVLVAFPLALRGLEKNTVAIR